MTEAKHLEWIGKVALLSPTHESIRHIIDIARVREEEELRNKRRKDLDILNAKYAHFKPSMDDIIKMGKVLSQFEKKKPKKYRKAGSLYHK